MDVYAGLTSGKVSLFTSMLAILVLVAGLVTTGRAVTAALDSSVALLAVAAAQGILWWIIAAALIAAAGKVTDAYIREGVVLYSYWTLPFSLVAAGLILTAALRIGENVLTGASYVVRVDEVLYVIAGFLFALTGTVTHTFVRQRAERQLLKEAFAPRGRSDEVRPGDGGSP